MEDAKVPVVRPELDVDVLANLLIESAITAISGLRSADTPEAAGDAAMPVLGSLGSIFLDYEAHPESRLIDLPADWTLGAMLRRVEPVLREEEDFGNLPDFSGNAEESVFLMIHKFLRDMSTAYFDLAEADRIDPLGDLSDFAADPGVQLQVLTWASLILGCESTDDEK